MVNDSLFLVKLLNNPFDDVEVLWDHNVLTRDKLYMREGLYYYFIEDVSYGLHELDIFSKGICNYKETIIVNGNTGNNISINFDAQLQIHDVCIALNENYEDVVVEVNSIVIEPIKSREYFIPNLDLAKNYDLLVTCEGYKDYDLKDIKNTQINVTLKSDSWSPRTIVGGILGTVAVIAGVLYLFTSSRDDPNDSSNTPPSFYKISDIDNNIDNND